MVLSPPCAMRHAAMLPRQRSTTRARSLGQEGEEEQEQEEEETRALRQVFAAGISGLELSSLGPEAEAARDELCAALWRGFEVSK